MYCQRVFDSVGKDPRPSYNTFISSRSFFHVDDNPTFQQRNIDVSSKLERGLMDNTAPRYCILENRNIGLHQRNNQRS